MVDAPPILAAQISDKMRGRGLILMILDNVHDIVDKFYVQDIVDYP